MKSISRIIFYLVVAVTNIHAQPSADFAISRTKICSGTTVSLTNASIGANSYSWFVDGVFFSHASDTVAKWIENCYDLKAIKLLACDTTISMCDSTTQYVDVFDSCFFHWTADISACPGDTIALNAHPEATATYWNIQPPHSFLTGCDTCVSISLILTYPGTMVDKEATYFGGCTETTSFHYLCLSSGIDEIENAFEIYPNPFDDRITVKGNNSIDCVELYNQVGERINQIKIIESQIDLSMLSQGVYFLRIFSGEKSLTKKIIRL